MMAMTRSEIQKRSDEKRGVRVKSLKMKVEDILLLEKLAAETGLAQGDLVAAALKKYAGIE